MYVFQFFWSQNSSTYSIVSTSILTFNQWLIVIVALLLTYEEVYLEKKKTSLVVQNPIIY